MINKNLIPGIKDAVVPKQLSSLTGQQPQQTISDFSKAANSKLQGELASKLSSSKLASSFTKLSSGVDLVQANNKIIASVSGTGQFIGDVEDLPESNIPAETLGSGVGGSTDQFKVTLTAMPGLGDGNDTIVFDVMPSISEDHRASYDSVNLIHHPGAILKYKGTEGRGWSVVADLVSRTVQEADKNLKYMNTIRGWMMPFYGVGTADNPATSSKLGAPPPVLILSAYGPKMIGPVTCVLEGFSWTFENEMDYIRTSDGTPFPVHLKAQLSLKETWTPSQFTSFDLMSYRAGNMQGAFLGPAPGQSSPGLAASAGRIPNRDIDSSLYNTVDPNAAAVVSSGSVAANLALPSMPSSLTNPIGSPSNAFPLPPTGGRSGGGGGGGGGGGR